MKTLGETFPDIDEFHPAAFKLINEPVKRLWDVSERMYPGQHKHVCFWAELANGRAVGFNENPARGYSFPVVRMEGK